jgi:hypothetical protein
MSTTVLGRNDSCACKSGKKFKHCCLKKRSRSEADFIKNFAPVRRFSKQVAADDRDSPRARTGPPDSVRPKPHSQPKRRDEPDASWLVITLRPIPNHDDAEIRLLRPPAWFAATGAKVGGQILLEIPDLRIRGWAEVLAIGPAPPIRDGDGRVVTGRFRHVAPEVLRVFVQGLDEPITCTPAHPFWSENRRDYVPACDLMIGELLRTSNGDVAAVERLELRQTPTTVYNIEVHGENCYRVSPLGILVHNASERANGRLTQHLEGADPGVSDLGAQLAGRSKGLLSKLSRSERSATTLAVSRATIGDRLREIVTINGGAPSSVLSKLQRELKNTDAIVLQAPGREHAETFLHRMYRDFDNFEAIGVSHWKGPCPPCRVEFNQRNFANVFWSSVFI